MVQIIFDFVTEYGEFRDALYLPDDHTFTDDEIQAMKQARLDNWIAIVTAPPVDAPLEPVGVDPVLQKEIV